jgi:uncharacterized protein YbjT (DUF2867 family)
VLGDLTDDLQRRLRVLVVGGGFWVEVVEVLLQQQPVLGEALHGREHVVCELESVAAGQRLKFLHHSAKERAPLAALVQEVHLRLKILHVRSVQLEERTLLHDDVGDLLVLVPTDDSVLEVAQQVLVQRQQLRQVVQDFVQIRLCKCKYVLF